LKSHLKLSSKLTRHGLGHQKIPNYAHKLGVFRMILRITAITPTTALTVRSLYWY